MKKLVYVALIIWLAWDINPVLPETPDGQVDYLILKAGWDGTDPTVPTIELAERYNMTGIYTTLIVSRTPGFYIANSPQLLDLETGIWAIRIANVTAAVAIGMIVSRMWPVRWWTITLPVLLLGWGWIAWATPGLVWAAAIAATWLLVGKGDRWWFGVPLGVAAAVRAWPAVVVVALWSMGYRKTAGGATITAAAFTLAGLALPGVTAERTIRSLSDTGFALAKTSNISLSTLLFRIGIPTFVTIAVAVILVGWIVKKMEPARGYGIAVMVGILVSPIAWPHYLAATAPMWPRLFGLPDRSEDAREDAQTDRSESYTRT